MAKLFAAILVVVIGIAAKVYAAPDIVFVTQPPHPADFATANATFGSHQATMDSVPRGGDLYIRYADGSLKNITASAGFGVSGFQGSNAIAVRDPSVHWNGSKIIFSMVIGAPVERYQVQSYRWQLYEVTGIGKTEQPVITKVSNQSASYNNVMPIYGTNERIIFVSDQPRAGLTHTYPQRDEYESTPTNTGLWSLDPSSGDLFQLDHSPSGDFSPSIDSFGRVIFTRWDHLQRDQQNRCSQPSFGAFNYSNESPSASVLNSDQEIFPEARGDCEYSQNSNLDKHSFNHFLPWQIREDGSDMETINHIGRHELVDYIGRSFNDDSNVEEFYGQYSRANKFSIENLFQIHEDPLHPGDYYGINGPEFGTHASGQVVIMRAPPSLGADKVSITYITHQDTASSDDTPSSNHSGLARDPLPLSDGTVVVAHSGTTLADTNTGSSTLPQSRYSFRLRKLIPQGEISVPGEFLTTGIKKTLNFWSPDQAVAFNNVTLWEIQPREIRVRSKPIHEVTLLAQPEQQIFDAAGVGLDEFKMYLQENNLALIVSRNITTRDNLDHQQPRNLQVAGSDTKTIAGSGKLYQVGFLQIFQGDLIRGYAGSSSSSSGRRVLAQPLHSLDANILPDNGFPGAVTIAADGSLAAFVPARRALTYQLTDSAGVGVVRERLWLTFQPGEIRVCGSCHGVNSHDQSGSVAPTNPPQALARLLEHWKGLPTESPEVELRVKITKKRRKKKSATSQVLSYSVTGKNMSVSGKTLTLGANVKDQECGSISQFVIDSSGRFEGRSRQFKTGQGNFPISFSVAYLGRVLDSENIVMKSKGRRARKLSQVCASIKKAFQ